MEFGFGIPAHAPIATPENMTTLAQQGEKMGFAIINVSDHIIFPTAVDSLYPYSPDGRYAGRGGPGGEYMEPLSLLSFLSGITSSVKLLTSVMVLPLRPPILTAKILATIDVLSHGRLIVGCGVGWMREEFEAIGAPPFDKRGAVSNEYIRAFKELWTNEHPTFEGEYCSFSNVLFAPKPVQKPHPPIWTGGESPAAMRRAGRLADAWYPQGSNPRFPVRTPDELAECTAKVKHYAQEAGRDPDSIGFVCSAPYNDQEAQTFPNGDRRPLTGTPAQISDDIKRYEEIGVRHIMVNNLVTRGPEVTVQQCLERMEHFATKMIGA